MAKGCCRHIANIPFSISAKEIARVRESQSKNAKTHVAKSASLLQYSSVLCFLFLFSSLFFFVSRTNLKACLLRTAKRERRDGGWNGKARIVFPDRIFTSRPSPSALTSIACPFSIRVHYEITGSLYEIHSLVPSPRGLPSTFFSFSLRFPAPFNRVSSCWK